METLEFFKKLEQDEELRQLFKDVKGPEDFYKVASENGLTDDFETMKAVAAKEMEKNGNVSEADLSKLEEVSGGEVSTADSIVYTINGSALVTSLVTTAIYSTYGGAAAAAAV